MTKRITLTLLLTALLLSLLALGNMATATVADEYIRPTRTPGSYPAPPTPTRPAYYPIDSSTIEYMPFVLVPRVLAQP